MSLSEQINRADNIAVIADGSLQVREETLVLRDGAELARSYYRYVLHPGGDLTGKDPRIVAVANATWTPEVIEAWKAAQEPVAA